MKSKIKNKQAGYVALITVIIIMAVSIIIGVTVSLNSVNEMQMSYQGTESQQAFIYADACCEEALLRLKRNETPPNTLNFTNGSCTIQVDNLGGNSRLIKATGVSNNIYRLIEVDLIVGPSFDINSWQEVSNFTN